MTEHLPEIKMFAIIGILYVSNLTWDWQVNFGNYLKHTHPESWWRKLWWAMCDREGGCKFCLPDRYSVLLYYPKQAEVDERLNNK